MDRSRRNRLSGVRESAAEGRRACALGAALACLTAIPAFAQTPRPIQVVPAQTVNDAVGINVHMEYTDGKYADVGAVLRDLAYLGITRVREAIPDPATWLPQGQGIAAVDRLAGDGIRFDLVVGATTSLPSDIHQIEALDDVKPGAVLSVEGPNEINNAPVHAPGLTNEQAATAFQHRLYEAVHAERSLSRLPVLYFTGGAKVDLSSTYDLANVANTHQYPHNGEQPASWLAASWTDYYTMPLGYPWELTETGYYTDPTSNDWGGVDAETQAKLLLNILMDAARMGIQATYIYQLLDPYPYGDRRAAGSDGHLGLFYYDGSPKPAAVALRRLRMELSGPQEESSVPRVQATVSGMPATGYALALPKADGTLVVALWNEVPAWDATTHRPLAPPAVPVTVQARGYGDAQLLDPITGAAKAFPAAGQAYDVSVPDSVVLLILHPAG